MQVAGSDLLTVKEVAELARVNPSTVTRWVHASKIPAIVLPSGQLRFVREDVDAMLTPTMVNECSESEGRVPLPGQAVLL
ncbi:hypothetical protein AKG36_07270 [Trueperella bernardiae]|nr:hypothetical protein AKG36_07270 [Trueperella bernardiae]